MTTTKGRKALPAAIPQGPEYRPNTLPDDAQAMEIMATVAASYSEERDLVNQLLGQAQALSATSAMLQTFGVSKIAFVKENKLYRGLTGKRAPNGLEFQGTWEEFCGLLWMSDEKANQDIANLKAFGDLPADTLAEVMAAGFTVAELAGRFEVAHGG